MCTDTIYMHVYIYIYIYVYILHMHLGRKCDREIGENLEENERGSGPEQCSLIPCIKFLNNF